MDIHVHIRINAYKYINNIYTHKHINTYPRIRKELYIPSVFKNITCLK